MGRYSMALNLTRTAFTQMGRRGLSLSAAKRADKMMPDPVEHATGLEKYKLLAKQAGNEDPFFLQSIGEREPRMSQLLSTLWTITGWLDVCVKKRTQLKWTWLSQGVPKRCECGYWMELKSHPAPDKYALPL